MHVAQERREWPRVKVNLPCEVQLLVADKTFTPHTAAGCIFDLAVAGVKVNVPNLPKEIFQKLLRSTRYARLTFSSPDGKSQIRVMGKIVWLNFNDDQKLLETVLFFQNIAPEAEIMLQRIVERRS
jgi:hypothetical protein